MPFCYVFVYTNSTFYLHLVLVFSLLMYLAYDDFYIIIFFLQDKLHFVGACL